MKEERRVGEIEIRKERNVDGWIWCEKESVRERKRERGG